MATTNVLVYGAGVLGCLLAHQLATAPDVATTLLARGTWAKTIERDGLMVRHVIQRTTTCDRIRVIEHLEPNDAFDLIFVVMQAPQVEDILPALAANGSARIVFVGNNTDARGVQKRMQALAREMGTQPKEIAFAFQSSCGQREADRAVAAYVKPRMTIGGADGPLSNAFRAELELILCAAGYELVHEDQMDAWLKCHAAFVLPIAFDAYANGCTLGKAPREQRRAVLDACREMYGLFIAHGIPIRPEGDLAYFEAGPKRMLMAAMVWVVFKTPIGKLVATDHCQHAVAEMRFLTSGLEALFAAAELDACAPAWQGLKRAMPSWESLLKNPCCGGC